MADEYSNPPHNRKLNIPKTYNWESLTNKKGAELELHYATLLRELSTAKGILGQIFTKSQNKIQDPAMLAKVIDMIDSEQWLVMGDNVKGVIYEGLLEKNAEDVKKRSRTILYTKTINQSNGRMYSAATDENHCRPSLRHRRFLSGSV